jgi:hypothetical protein
VAEGRLSSIARDTYSWYLYCRGVHYTCTTGIYEIALALCSIWLWGEGGLGEVGFTEPVLPLKYSEFRYFALWIGWRVLLDTCIPSSVPLRIETGTLSRLWSYSGGSHRGNFGGHGGPPYLHGYYLRSKMMVY